MTCRRPPTQQPALRAAGAQAAARHNPRAAAGARAALPSCAAVRAAAGPCVSATCSAASRALRPGRAAAHGAAALAGGGAACNLRQRATQHGRGGRRKQCAGRVEQEEGAQREVAGAAAGGGLAVGRQQARGASAAHAAHAAHATRGQGVRAQAQAHDKREEGKRDKARGTALAASSSV
jgi:hypothetical protein